ncbi:MAG: phosphoribosyltransferase [Deltaproteobacteria bacterium]|nr:phosphoribosyltransferase [Deltaproteobacteria bacterium]
MTQIVLPRPLAVATGNLDPLFTGLAALQPNVVVHGDAGVPQASAYTRVGNGFHPGTMQPRGFLGAARFLGSPPSLRSKRMTPPASVKLLMDKMKEGRNLEFYSEVGEMAHHMGDWVKCLIEGRPGLNPEEFDYLNRFTQYVFEKVKKAPRFSARFGELGVSPYVVRKMATVIHGFGVIEGLLDVFKMDANLDLLTVLHALECYDGSCQFLEHSVAVGRISEQDVEDAILNDARELFFKRVCAFVESRGYLGNGSLRGFAYKIIRGLLALKGSYDLFVPVAKGGLYAGALADLLGLKTCVIEVHAHNKKHPTSHVVDQMTPEDIKGKRVLLLDNDTVTGASVQEAMRLLSAFEPSLVDVFLCSEPSEHTQSQGSSPAAIAKIEKSGVRVFHHNNIKPVPMTDVFYAIHENLNTVLGRLSKVERGFEELLPQVDAECAADAKTLREFIREQKEVYFALNQFLPGVDRVRGSIVSRLEYFLRLFEGRIAHGAMALSLGEGGFFNREMQIIKTATMFLPDIAETLAIERYRHLAADYAKKRGIESIPTIPQSYTAAFLTAQAAFEDGYDVALIVGPEAFSFEPLFVDLGISTVAVNIPEIDYDGDRTLTILDSLSKLKGKKVLVVEDDIRSGATLRALVKGLQPALPKKLGLFLGLPIARQRLESIPAIFDKAYTTNTEQDEDMNFLQFLMEREVLFKRQIRVADFRK